MSYTIRWILDDPPGEEGTQSFDGRDVAMETALAKPGVALVARDPAGSVVVIDHGHVLDGPEPSEVFLRFPASGRGAET